MRAYIVVGLGFGDEGKGTIVDTLVRETGAPLVVRFNGGAQAAHHVVAPEGSHCFAQFGAGTLAGAHTFLTENVIVDPPALFREAQHLESIGIADPFRRIEISPGAPIVTPWHRALNQLREVKRGSGKHGSCGRGIGEVVREIGQGRQYICASELRNPLVLLRTAFMVRERLIQDALAADLMSVDHWARETIERSAEEWVADIVKCTALWRLSGTPTWPEDKPVIFEGAQGVLLDQWQGFHPFTTWSTTTPQWAEDVIARAPYRYEPVKVGVIRTFLTRHGAGPFPTETIQLQSAVKDDANSHNDWQGSLRTGSFDFMLLHYAINACNGVDTLAVTHCDKPAKQAGPWFAAHAYKKAGALMTEIPVYRENQTLNFNSKLTGLISDVQPIYERYDTVYELLADIEAETAIKVGITSWGPGTGVDQKTITDGCPCRKDVRRLFRTA